MKHPTNRYERKQIEEKLKQPKDIKTSRIRKFIKQSLIEEETKSELKAVIENPRTEYVTG